MATMSNSIVISRTSFLQFSSDSSLKPAGNHVLPINLAFKTKSNTKSFTRRSALMVQASYSDNGSSGNPSAFIGGFVLGGLIVGTLGCVYAPQISRTLTGAADKTDLMKKLPKFIYDEEKALEKQRKKLTDRIEQLNSAIDSMSTQMRPEESQIEEVVSANDIEAVV